MVSINFFSNINKIKKQKFLVNPNRIGSMRNATKLLLTLTLFNIFINQSLVFGNDLVIGFIGGLTSKSSFLEIQESKAALEMLIDETNQRGGVNGRKVRIVSFDTKGSPSVAYSLMDDLDHANLDGLIGFYYSNEAVALASFLERKKVPTIVVTAASPLISAGKRFIIQKSITDDEMGIGLARKTYEINKRRIIVAKEATSLAEVAFSSAFITEFKRLGGKIIDEVNVSLDQGSIGTAAYQIKEKTNLIDAVAVFANTLHIAYLWVELERRGVSKDFVTSDSLMFQDPIPVVRFIKDRFKVLLYPDEFDQSHRTKEFQQFCQRLKKKLPTSHELSANPDYASETYDAGKILLHAFGSTSTTDPEEVMKFVRKTHFNGLSSRVQFDKTGKSKRKTMYLRYDTGRVISY